MAWKTASSTSETDPSRTASMPSAEHDQPGHDQDRVVRADSSAT